MQNRGNETKKERFKRIIVTRVNKVLDGLRFIGHCARKKFYEYSFEDVEDVFDALYKGVTSSRMQYCSPPPKKKFPLTEQAVDISCTNFPPFTIPLPDLPDGSEIEIGYTQTSVKTYVNIHINGAEACSAKFYLGRLVRCISHCEEEVTAQSLGKEYPISAEKQEEKII